MANITPPKNAVPVGRVTINGQTFDVQQHPEFVRFFFDLFQRVGGTSALSNTDLAALTEINAFAPMPAFDASSQFEDVILAPPFIQSPERDVVAPNYEPALQPDDSNGRLQALEAEVTRLARTIHDLQIGYQL